MDYKHQLTAFCVLTLNQIILFNVFPLHLALTMQIVSNCGVCTYKSAYLLRALLKVSLQCWVVTHMSFSGVLLLLCSLWRIIYMSSCLVALLKLLLSGQMCLPGYSINFCFCEVGACHWNEHVYAPLTDAAACAGSFIRKNCSLWLTTMNADLGETVSGCVLHSCLKPR